MPLQTYMSIYYLSGLNYFSELEISAFSEKRRFQNNLTFAQGNEDSSLINYVG